VEQAVNGVSDVANWGEDLRDMLFNLKNKGVDILSLLKTGANSIPGILGNQVNQVRQQVNQTGQRFNNAMDTSTALGSALLNDGAQRMRNSSGISQSFFSEPRDLAADFYNETAKNPVVDGLAEWIVKEPQLNDALTFLMNFYQGKVQQQ